MSHSGIWCFKLNYFMNYQYFFLIKFNIQKFAVNRPKIGYLKNDGYSKVPTLRVGVKCNKLKDFIIGMRQ